jgi:predicted Zn-dependent protease
MGYLELRAGDHDEARKWYQEAIKLDSADYLAYYNFAALSLNDSLGPDDKAIEDSLRKAIQLNPQFAPSYDRLAAFYAMRHENLDEAHMLSVQAVQLDPSEVIFRMNAANVLMAMERYDDAENVLKVAEKVAKNPGQVAMVENQIEQIERFRKQRAEAEAARNANESPGVVTLVGEQPASANGTPEQITIVAKPPKHPTVPDTGRKHIATGTIHGVVCSFPMVVEFRLETAAGKSLALYNNSFDKLDMSAVKAMPGTVDPCADFEGKKVEVEYVDSPDKTVSGEVIAVMLKN